MKSYLAFLISVLMLTACQIETTDDSEFNQEKVTDGNSSFQEQDSDGYDLIELLQPMSESTLADRKITFVFNSSKEKTAWLYIGTQSKSNDLYDGLLNQESVEVAIPLNGEPVFLTIWNELNDEWLAKEYVFYTHNLNEDQKEDGLSSDSEAKESDTDSSMKENDDTTLTDESLESNEGKDSSKDQSTSINDSDNSQSKISTLTFPLEGQVIEETSITLSISHNESNWIYLGSSKGGRDIANEKMEGLTFTSVVPSDVLQLHITLWSLIDSEWKYESYVFDTRFDMEQKKEDQNENKDVSEEVTSTEDDSEGQHSYADILVLFNQGARASVDEEAWALSAITYLNQTLENSDTLLRFRLAGVDKAPAEYDRMLTSSDPERMKTDSQIQALKEEYGADIVGMLTDTAKDWCGYSKIPKSNTEERTIIHTNSQYFWNLLRCGQRNFTHEVGHSMGLRHSEKESPNPTGNHIWARGYGVYDRFSTMMGYASSYNKGWGNELPIFSNPKIVECDGLVCGVERHHEDGADAAYFINRMAPAIENLNESKLAAPVPY